MVFKSIALLALSVTPLLAALEDQAEEYAKDLFKVHKNLKKESSTSKAIAAFIDDTKSISVTIFSLSPLEKSTLKRKDDVISKNEFNLVVDQLKAFKNNPEATFLIHFIEKEEPKLELRLFLYRYINAKLKHFTKAQDDFKLATLSKIQSAYTSKKNSLGRAPSFEELSLPHEISKYTDPESGKEVDWLYVGDKKYTSSDIQVVAAIPVLLPNGKVLAIREDGTTTKRLSFSKVTSVMHQETSAPAAKLQNISKTSVTSSEAKESIDPFYLEILLAGAKTVIERHQKYKASSLYAKATANGIAQLNFSKKEDTYKSANESSTHTWLYLGAKHEIIHGSGKRIICMTNSTVAGDRYLGFSEDLSVLEVSEDQYKQILQHGVN